MFTRTSAVTVLSALVAIFAGAAQAQEINPSAIARNLERAVNDLTGQGKRNGHDECKGNGHQNSNGGGHEDGECEEEPAPAPTGPVGETTCATADPESAYQRYACEISIVAENYVTGSATTLQGDVAANVAEAESYASNTLTLNGDYQAVLTDYVDATVTDVTGVLETATVFAPAVLANLGDGGNILDGVGPVSPPLPKDDYLTSIVYTSGEPVNTDYSAELVDFTLVTTGSVLESLGDGGNVLDGIGPVSPPLPKREDFTATVGTESLSLSYGDFTLNADAAPVTDYSTDIGNYSIEYVDGALTGLAGSNYDGGNILDGMGPVSPPQPKRDELQVQITGY